MRDEARRRASLRAQVQLPKYEDDAAVTAASVPLHFESRLLTVGLPSGPRSYQYTSLDVAQLGTARASAPVEEAQPPAAKKPTGVCSPLLHARCPRVAARVIWQPLALYSLLMRACCRVRDCRR